MLINREGRRCTSPARGGVKRPQNSYWGNTRSFRCETTTYERARNPFFVCRVISELYRLCAFYISQGQGPLHAACRNGHGEIVRALLSAGVDPFLADEYGSTPFDLARDWQRLDIQEMLRGASAAADGQASWYYRSLKSCVLFCLLCSNPRVPDDRVSRGRSGESRASCELRREPDRDPSDCVRGCAQVSLLTLWTCGWHQLRVTSPSRPG